MVNRYPNTLINELNILLAPFDHMIDGSVDDTVTNGVAADVSPFIITRDGPRMLGAFGMLLHMGPRISVDIELSYSHTSKPDFSLRLSGDPKADARLIFSKTRNLLNLQKRVRANPARRMEWHPKALETAVFSFRINVSKRYHGYDVGGMTEAVISPLGSGSDRVYEASFDIGMTLQRGVLSLQQLRSHVEKFVGRNLNDTQMRVLTTDDVNGEFVPVRLEFRARGADKEELKRRVEAFIAANLQDKA